MDYQQHDEKGLFTFYREQAELQQQIRAQRKRKKLQQRNNHSKNIEQKVPEQAIAQKQNKQKQQRLGNAKQKTKEKIQKNPHEPKCILQHQRYGDSVVILKKANETSQNCQSRGQVKIHQCLDGATKIQGMINMQNNNRYFLQNKQIPVNFGNANLERHLTNINLLWQHSMIQQRPNQVKITYFNHPIERQGQKKYGNISNFSYDRLPEIIDRNKARYSQIKLPRKLTYKSQKITEAIKSGNTEIIRRIRQSIRKESYMKKEAQDDSFTALNKVLNISESCTPKKLRQSDQWNLLGLNRKQKKLMSIICSNSPKKFVD